MRVAVSLYLVLVTLAGPAAACCCVGRSLVAGLTPSDPEPVAARPAPAKSCCHCDAPPPAADETAPAPARLPSGPCPCRDGGANPALAERAADLALTMTSTEGGSTLPSAVAAADEADTAAALGLHREESSRSFGRGRMGWLVAAARELVRGEPDTLAGEVLKAVERRRLQLWRDRVEQVNWELFDRGTEAFTWYALEELTHGAVRADLAGKPEVERFAAESTKVQLGKEHDRSAFGPFGALRQDLEKPFRERVVFWQRSGGPKGDLVDDEFGRVLQVPGWSNIFTQPIINRIEMLSTGVRTDIGIKVFAPDLDTAVRVSQQVEAAVKPIRGARDVIAAPVMGKGYLDVTIDRQKAARYGITVEDVQTEIETALGGRVVTYTVENRDRFPVRVRYARVSREDEAAVRRPLVTGSAARERTAPGPHETAPGHAARGKMLIPLGAVIAQRFCSPSPLRGGGWGEGLRRSGTGRGGRRADRGFITRRVVSCVASCRGRWRWPSPGRSARACGPRRRRTRRRRSRSRAS